MMDGSILHIAQIVITCQYVYMLITQSLQCCYGHFKVHAHIDIALFMTHDLVTIVDLQPLQRQGDVDSTYYLTKEVGNGHVFHHEWTH